MTLLRLKKKFIATAHEFRVALVCFENKKSLSKKNEKSENSRRWGSNSVLNQVKKCNQ